MTTDEPRVQIPLSAEYHGLSIDGEFVHAWPEDERDHPGDENLPHYRDYLPKRANDAYWAYYNTDNLGRVYQCTECGYLTMAEGARSSKVHRQFQCTNCEKNGTVSTSWVHVAPDPVHEQNQINVLTARSEQEEFDPEKPMGVEVPNHPSHLSRIQNQLKNHVTRDELLEITATAVSESRKKDHIDY